MPPPTFEHLQEGMERGSARLRDSQLTLRRTVLGLLSPAQREFVAAVIGQLATTPDPDVAPAVQRINAALSPAQREAIPRLVAAEASRREAMFHDMVRQSQQELAAQVPPAAPPMHPGPTAPNSPGIVVWAGPAMAMSGSPMLIGMVPGQSAGTILLMLLMSPGGSLVQPVPVLIHGTLQPTSQGTH